MNDTPRTLKQNAALHKWFRLLSDQLNEAGLDMVTVLKPGVEIPWTPENVKNLMWKPVQEAYLNKESTADANTTDYDAVYQVIARHLGEKFGLTVPPFPDRFTQGLDDVQ